MDIESAMYRQHYSRFLSSDPDRLHFAAHSHHYWLDATRAAHLQYWDDAARWVDDKWDHIIGEVVPRAQRNIAEALGLRRPADIALAPSTHELVARLISCFPPTGSFRVLTTDGEFHSFARQVDRLEELPQVCVTRVPVAPFESFAERFRREAAAHRYDLVYLSHVFFGSGFAVTELPPILDAVRDERTAIVVDGYHAFCALPVDLGPVEERIFYVGGGYKYAQAGEGICFMSLPAACDLRPLHTGWFASFGTLQEARVPGESVPYAADAFRFWGATFDPAGAYRLNAVFDWMREHGLTVASIHAHVQEIQKAFLERLASRSGTGTVLRSGALLHSDLTRQGHFFAFAVPDARSIYQRLRELDIVVDMRGDVIRFGFGLYHTVEDLERLFERLDANQL